MIKLFAAVVARFGINPREAERFAKFLVVGTLGFVIDFGTLTFLVEVVDLPGLVADNTQFAEIASRSYVGPTSTTEGHLSLQISDNLEQSQIELPTDALATMVWVYGLIEAENTPNWLPI